MNVSYSEKGNKVLKFDNQLDVAPIDDNIKKNSEMVPTLSRALN